MPCLFAVFEICHRSHSPLCSLFQIPKPTKIQVKIGQLILSPLLNQCVYGLHMLCRVQNKVFKINTSLINMSLKIVVLAKQVPDTRNVGKDAMTPEGTVNRAALPAIFNPEDRNALEQALR